MKCTPLVLATLVGLAVADPVTNCQGPSTNATINEVIRRSKEAAEACLPLQGLERNKCVDKASKSCFETVDGVFARCTDSGKGEKQCDKESRPGYNTCYDMAEMYLPNAGDTASNDVFQKPKEARENEAKAGDAALKFNDVLQKSKEAAKACPPHTVDSDHCVTEAMRPCLDRAQDDFRNCDAPGKTNRTQCQEESWPQVEACVTLENALKDNKTNRAQVSATMYNHVLQKSKQAAKTCIFYKDSAATIVRLKV